MIGSESSCNVIDNKTFLDLNPSESITLESQLLKYSPIVPQTSCQQKDYFIQTYHLDLLMKTQTSFYVNLKLVAAINDQT